MQAISLSRATEDRSWGYHDNCVAGVVCLRLQLMVRFTGIHTYVQPGVPEPSCTLEEKSVNIESYFS